MSSGIKSTCAWCFGRLQYSFTLLSLPFVLYVSFPYWITVLYFVIVLEMSLYLYPIRPLSLNSQPQTKSNAVQSISVMQWFCNIVFLTQQINRRQSSNHKKWLKRRLNNPERTQFPVYFLINVIFCLILLILAAFHKPLLHRLLYISWTGYLFPFTVTFKNYYSGFDGAWACGKHQVWKKKYWQTLSIVWNVLPT